MDKRSELESCLADLQGILNEFDALIEMVQEAELAGVERQQAEAKLRALKDRLRSEYVRTRSVKAKSTLNEVELRYYAPAVHEATCDLDIRVNSVPGPSWSYSLMSARLDIETIVLQLEDRLR